MSIFCFLFSVHKTIPAGGYFILGQEQDEVGRNFSAGEAFMGSLSQLNMWNTVLPESEILEMSRYRCDNVAGNIVAWADFLRSKYQVKDVRDFCTGKEVVIITCFLFNLPNPISFENSKLLEQNPELKINRNFESRFL